MLSDFAKNCRTLERAVLTSVDARSKRNASEALLDCLLVILEAADEIGLSNTTFVLDICADVAFSEVKGRAVPAKTLGAILQVSEVANEAISKLDPPFFASRRRVIEPSAAESFNAEKSA